jgi:hypothetical protein
VILWLRSQAGKPNHRRHRDSLHNPQIREKSARIWVTVHELLVGSVGSGRRAGRCFGRRRNHRDAARLCGAADAIRARTGAVRFRIYDADHEATVIASRDALGENDFNATWAEGSAMSTPEAVAYAQRGRGERKRPSRTPARFTLVDNERPVPARPADVLVLGQEWGRSNADRNRWRLPVLPCHMTASSMRCCSGSGQRLRSPLRV